MKVLELLEEIEEIIDIASSVPLTGKIMVDGEELLQITKEIRMELPEEIQQAQWIKNERDRILGDAKNEYDTVIKSAETRAEELVETDDIMVRAKQRAEELMSVTEENIKQLKMSTYDYVDGILFDFQEKMEELNGVYFNDMFNNLEVTFNEISGALASNREEIKEMAYKTSMNIEGEGTPPETEVPNPDFDAKGDSKYEEEYDDFGYEEDR